MFSPQKKSNVTAKGLVVAVFLVLFLSGCAQQNQQVQDDNNQTAAQPSDGNTQEPGGQIDAEPGQPSLNPTDYAVRQRYFQAAFQPERSSYNLFSNAAEFLNISIQNVPAYFSLNS